MATVYACMGWPVQGKKAHEVSRYRIGQDGPWENLAEMPDDRFRVVVEARRDIVLSHGMCDLCEKFYEENAL